MPGPVSSISKRAISRWCCTRSAPGRCAVNFTALPSRLMRIWRSRFSSARTTGGSAPSTTNRQSDAAPCGLQLEQAHDLGHAVGKAHRPHFQRQLAGLDAGDVQRAFDQPEQVVAAAADHAHRLRRWAGIASSSSSSWA
jgi:hypothetical protein